MGREEGYPCRAFSKKHLACTAPTKVSVTVTGGMWGNCTTPPPLKKKLLIELGKKFCQWNKEVCPKGSCFPSHWSWVVFPLLPAHILVSCRTISHEDNTNNYISLRRELFKYQRRAGEGFALTKSKYFDAFPSQYEHTNLRICIYTGLKRTLKRCLKCSKSLNYCA